MKHSIVWMLLLMAAAAYAADPGRTDQSKPGAQGASEIKGIELRFDSSKPTFGEVEGPAFSVHADTGTQAESLRLWSLKDTRAVIYRKPEENLVLIAKSMTFDLNRNAAQMTGGVHVTSGRLVVDVDDISWDDKARIARSDSTTTLYDGANRITASSIAIYPDKDRIEMGGGSGAIQLAQAVAEKPEDKSSSESQFKELRIEKYQNITGNLKGSPIEEIKGPVQMVMVGKIAEDTITMNADLVRMEFTPDSDDRSPRKVMLRGHVKVLQSSATVVSKDADLDMDSGKALFTGDVKLTSDRVNGASGPSLEMNLKTGEFELKGSANVVSISMENPDPKTAKDKKKP